MRHLAWLPICVVLATLAGACAPGPGENSIQNRNEAISLFQVGKIAKAKAMLDRSLSWNPADPEALYYMGRIACTEQEWEKAIGYFDQCLNADPAFPTAKQWLMHAEGASGLGTKLRTNANKPPKP